MATETDVIHMCFCRIKLLFCSVLFCSRRRIGPRCCTCATLPDRPTTRCRSRARPRLCRRTDREISVHNIGGMRRIQLASRRPANACVAALRQKFPHFNVLRSNSRYSRDVRFMGFKTRVHTTRTNVSSNSALTSYYWTGAPVFFSTGHFPPLFVNMTQKNFDATKYSVSSLSIYYCSKFLRDCETRYANIER